MLQANNVDERELERTALEKKGFQFNVKLLQNRKSQFSCKRMKWSSLIEKWKGPFTFMDLQSLIEKLPLNHLCNVILCTEHSMKLNDDNIIKIRGYPLYNTCLLYTSPSPRD